MTREEKQLLLKDLCARLPYGIKIQRDSVYDADIKVIETLDLRLMADDIEYDAIEGLHIKPYLRPMSSMTEEEADEWTKASNMKFDMEDGFLDVYDAHLSVDWLLSHHFDFRGLIPMGLALEAKEGIYKTE